MRGTITALITPFKGERLDEEGLRRNIERQIEAGVTAILGLGTTGEAATQTKAEQERVIEIMVRAAKGVIPVIVGTGHNSTAETIARTKRAKELGADMALVVAPYYNRPTQEGIFCHYEAISNAVDLPIMAYNIPKRTAVNIDVQTIQRLATLKNVVALKDDIPQSSEIFHLTHLTLFAEDDLYAVPMIAIGASGVVSVVSNLVPKKVVAMVKAALNFDFETARRLHFELLPLIKAAFIETNPAPIKEMMNLLGLPAGNVRLPLCNLNEQNKKTVKQILDTYEKKFSIRKTPKELHLLRNSEAKRTFPAKKSKSAPPLTRCG